MNEHDDIAKNIKRLLALLKKMMAQEGASSNMMQGQVPPELQQMLKNQKNVNLNLCVFAFLPIHPEELEELEDEFLEGLDADGAAEKDQLSEEITESDVDFLKQNGIKY